jgi:hypothetical protein
VEEGPGLLLLPPQLHREEPVVVVGLLTGGYSVLLILLQQNQSMSVPGGRQECLVLPVLPVVMGVVGEIVPLGQR